MSLYFSNLQQLIRLLCLTCYMCLAEKKRQETAVAQAAAEAGVAQPWQRRSRQMQEGKIRCTWISWDPELLAAEVAAQFPVVQTSGCAMHQPLFEDLVREVAGGKRSFEEWTRSLKKHQKHLFYAAANQWVEYLLRCERALQLFRPRSSAEPAAEPTAAAAEAERPAAAAVSAAGTAAGAAAGEAAGAAAARQGLKANLPAATSSLRRPLSKKAKQQQQPGLKQATLFMFNTEDAMGRQRSASAAREGSSSMAAGTAAATAASSAAAGEAGVSGVVSPTQRGSSVQPDTAAADAGGSFQPAAAQATAASSVAGAAGDGSKGSSKRKAAALETAD
jgi:hypothetical protein